MNTFSFVRLQLSLHNSILYNVRVQCWGVLDHFWSAVVQRYATEDAGQIVNWFIYNLHVRNYNHLFHSCTFTQFTNTTL
jgi:hypothetical protein